MEDPIFIEDVDAYHLIEARANQVTQLKLETSDILGDWYLIVRNLPLDLRACTNIPTEYGSRFAITDRVASACVEGSLQEMKQIAQAIVDKQDASPGRRCAVIYQAESVHSNPQLNTDESVRFTSPRNCDDYGPQFPYQEALSLANQILAYNP